MRAVLIALAIVTSSFVACKQSEPAPEAVAELASYTVRGQYAGLDEGLVAIHHEAIPSFVNIRGDKVGMMSMQMSFRVAPSVTFEGLAPKTPIEFSFRVDWDKSPAIEVTDVKPLPAGTKLEI